MSNYMFVASSLAEMQRVAEEYAYIGRYVTVDEKTLTVTLHALPPKKEKKKKDDRRNDRARDTSEAEDNAERSESEARPTRRTNGFTRGKYIEGTD